MNKSNKAALLREKWLFMYTSALDGGDFETVAKVLRQAERDALLAKQIAEIDAALADETDKIVPLPFINHNHRQTKDRSKPMMTTYPAARTHRRVTMQGWLPAAIAAAMVLLVFGAVFAWQQARTLQPLSEPLSTQAAALGNGAHSPIQMAGSSDNGDPLMQGATLDNCQLTTGAQPASLYAQPDRNAAVVGTLPANSTLAVSVSAVRIFNNESWVQISAVQGSGWLNTADLPSQQIVCGSFSTLTPTPPGPDQTATFTPTPPSDGQTVTPVPSATPVASSTPAPTEPAPSATPSASVMPPPTMPGIVIDLPEECRAIIDQLQVIYTDPAATGIAAASDMPVTVPADVNSVTVGNSALWVEITITGTDSSVGGWVPIAPDIPLEEICGILDDTLPIIVPIPTPVIPPVTPPPGVTIVPPTFVPPGTIPPIPTIVIPPLPPPVQTLIATVRPPAFPTVIVPTVVPPVVPTVVVPTFVPPAVPTMPPVPAIPTVVTPPIVIPTIEIPPIVIPPIIIPTIEIPPIPTFTWP
jgi:hypothetical protein